MKEFVKTMLAVICGLLVLQILRFLLFFVIFGSALASGSGSSIPRSGVLDLDLSSFTLSEQSQESMPAFSLLGGMSGSMVPAVGLKDAVEAIKIAASDPAVRYILVRADNGVASPAGYEELRAALTDFRRSGKAVIAYTENPGNGSYYLSSVADKIYMGSQHGGNNTFIGLSGQMQFVKDLLDKLGVNVQLIRHGKYKSAGEMFIRNSASPENRQQNLEMVTSVWKSFSGAICEAREISPEKLDALLDNLSLVFPEDFLSNGLVDELVDHDALVQKLCTAAQVEDMSAFHLIGFPDYVSNRVGVTFPGRSNVAVIYADGEITDGSDYRSVSGDRFVKVIDEVRRDKSVKAVVLRVNSPGGSVAASVKIRTALDQLQKEKPLVASYGTYAASGGYWISNGCQKIYADATTVTGSIGVFSMIPEFSQVTKKVGVGIESVGTHKHSDMFSLVRPFDATELAAMQASVEDIYESFVNLVASSRGMESAAVDEIAQGRVWTGADALRIGLVDEIGTLQDAITYAASLADFYSSDEYTVVDYPKPLTVLEEMMYTFGANKEEPSILSDTPFAGLGRDLRSLMDGEPARVYARLPYTIEIR